MSLRPAFLLALALAPAPARSQRSWERAAPAAASASAAPERPPDLLWELPATAPCRLSLVHLDGAVEVVVGRTGARLLGEGPALAGRGRRARRPDGFAAPAHGRPGGASRGPGAASEAGASPESPPALLEVPAGCDLAIRTGAGAVEVHGSRLGRLAAESSTGGITLWVAPSVEPAVEVATSGEITVDFSITIEYFRHQEPAKLGRIEPGASVSWAQLRSRQGSIRVLKGHPRHSPNDLP